MFQDYKINGLESNRVYELVIETPDAAVTTTTATQRLIVNFSPANAMVLIDSKLYRGNGRIETVLPVGEHKYIIAADGYISVEGAVMLNERGTREITERLLVDNNTDSFSIGNMRPEEQVTKKVDNSNKYINDKNTVDEKDRRVNIDKQIKIINKLKNYHGYKAFVEGGYTIGVGKYSANIVSLFTTHGYRFNNHIFVGVGTGINYMYEKESKGIPVFLDMSLTIFNRRISPYIDLKGGYTIDIENMEGLFALPSIGVRYASHNKGALYFGVGYGLQDAMYNHGYNTRHTQRYSGITLKLCYEF